MPPLSVAVPARLTLPLRPNVPEPVLTSASWPERVPHDARECAGGVAVAHRQDAAAGQIIDRARPAELAHVHAVAMYVEFSAVDRQGRDARSQGGVIACLDNPGVDGRAAAVAVGAAEGQRAAADLRQCAASRDDSGNRHGIVLSVDRQRRRRWS